MSTELQKKAAELSKVYKSIGQPEFVRSGSVVLDAILGGGIPKGVFILWSAEPGCGKSTGSLHISRTYCAQNKKVVYLDYEGGVNHSQLEGMGLLDFKYDPIDNPEGTFFLYQVQTFKDAEKVLDEIMADVDLVVIDSATAMLTEKVKGSSSEDVLPGVDSRVMSTFLKKYKAEAVRNGVSWIIVNQMRTKISFMGATGDVEAGGNALKFYTDIRLVMKKAFKGTLERSEDTATGKQKVPFGAICTIQAVKNRYERPNIPLNIAIIFGKGIGNDYAYADFLMNGGVLVKSGAWYTFKIGNVNEKVNGLTKAIDWINDNKSLVRNYITSKGGYRLLLNEENPVEIGASDDMSQDIYGEATMVDEFESELDSLDSNEDSDEKTEPNSDADNDDNSEE
jgi:recombination protein RecA